MNDDLKKKLEFLADKYEISAFTEQDPSQFLNWYKNKAQKSNQADIETAAFISAMLAFGNRKQFIPKIQQILTMADGSSGTITSWLKTDAFKKDFPRGENKFYRFYSYDDMHIFFEELADILKNTASLGEYFYNQFNKDDFLPNEDSAGEKMMACFAKAFPRSKIVPKGKNSANKRIHMFLRWMVRQNSPVDLGIWTWYNPCDLIIPLDVHVMQESIKLGLLPQKSLASLKTAKLLTKQMELVFKDDPCRADFALFGLGVDD